MGHHGYARGFHARWRVLPCLLASLGARLLDDFPGRSSLASLIACLPRTPWSPTEFNGCHGPRGIPMEHDGAH
eukprot:3234250-Pyramimonas_sp.AAC.1